MKRQRKMALKLIEEVQVSTAGSADSCVVTLGQEPVVLSFDAAYELALQLASWIQSDGEMDGRAAAH